jgi:hypothetical protein
MDWHFRVNQRSTETEKRGQHRSWLVDEMVRTPIHGVCFEKAMLTVVGLDQHAGDH